MDKHTGLVSHPLGALLTLCSYSRVPRYYSALALFFRPFKVISSSDELLFYASHRFTWIYRVIKITTTWNIIKWISIVFVEKNIVQKLTYAFRTRDYSCTLNTNRIISLAVNVLIFTILRTRFRTKFVANDYTLRADVGVIVQRVRFLEI